MYTYQPYLKAENQEKMVLRFAYLHVTYTSY